MTENDWRPRPIPKNHLIATYLDAIDEGITTQEPLGHPAWMEPDQREFYFWLNKRNGVLDAFRVEWKIDPNKRLGMAWINYIGAMNFFTWHGTPASGDDIDKIPRAVRMASTHERQIAARVIARLTRIIMNREEKSA